MRSHARNGVRSSFSDISSEVELLLKVLALAVLLLSGNATRLENGLSPRYMERGGGRTRRPRRSLVCISSHLYVIPHVHRTSGEHEDCPGEFTFYPSPSLSADVDGGKDGDGE